MSHCVCGRFQNKSFTVPSNTTRFYSETDIFLAVYDHHQAINTVSSFKVILNTRIRTIRKMKLKKNTWWICVCVCICIYIYIYIYIYIELYLNLKYCIDGSIMVVNDRNMKLFLNKSQLCLTTQYTICNNI